MEKYNNLEITSGGWKLPNPKEMITGTVVFDNITEQHYIVETVPANIKLYKSLAKQGKIFSYLALSSFILTFAPAVFIMVFLGPPLFSGQFDTVEEVLALCLPILIPSLIILLIFATISTVFNILESKAMQKALPYKKSRSHWEVYAKPDTHQMNPINPTLNDIPSAS